MSKIFRRYSDEINVKQAQEKKPLASQKDDLIQAQRKERLAQQLL